MNSRPVAPSRKSAWLPASGLVMLLMILITAPSSCSTMGSGNSAVEDDSSLLWGPYITGTSSTTATINWKMEGSNEGTVEYSTENDYQMSGGYEFIIYDTAKQLHQVSLSQLKPATPYHYRIVTGDRKTADGTFRTLGGESFKFIVYGDTQEQFPTFTQLERHKLVADRIASEADISFVIHTGDVVSQPDSPDELNRFFSAARAMLANTTLFVVRANHDRDEQSFDNLFGYPNWYSFDCGNSHFTLMDSNNEADARAETEWLRDDLSCDAKFKFVFFHHPFYSSDAKIWGGSPQLRDLWEDIFTNQHIFAVFNGHVHAYERINVQGIHYIVSGIGGGPSYDLAEAKVAGYQNSAEFVLGYARITVTGEKAVIEIIKVADISRKGEGVEKIYPPNTILETIQ